MAEVVEHGNLESESEFEILEILEKNNLFTQRFYFRLAWHIKEGRFRWWHRLHIGFTMPVMYISPSGNTIDFMVPPASSLLPKIRDVAKQITKRLDLDVHIYPL